MRRLSFPFPLRVAAAANAFNVTLLLVFGGPFGQGSAAQVTAPASANVNSGIRCSQTSSATRSSIRARCDPMHRWMPRPNAA